MSSKNKCLISDICYAKIILHSHKYFTQAINGVLIGKYESNTKTIKALDAIPLFHQNLSLLPMLEVALSQIEIYCKEQSSEMKIIGYYFANEICNDSSVGMVHQSIASKIKSNESNIVMVQLDNITLGNVFAKEQQVELAEEATSFDVLHVCAPDGKLWKELEVGANGIQYFTQNNPSDDSVTILEDKQVVSIVKDLLKEDKQNDISDFDSHLDDPQHNSYLNHSITEYIKNQQ